MAGVIVRWSGQCPSHEVQSDLCKFVDDLGRRSHSFFKELLVKWNQSLEPRQIKRRNNRIKGTILLSPSLLGEASPDQCGVKFIETEEDVDYAGTTKSVKLALLDEMDLYGVEFYLYDPRHWEELRMSFVFLLHESPCLNGLLVEVEDRNECQYYYNETIKQADWYLRPPEMQLRYYLENWFAYIMGWTKYFFIPGLNYWYYGDLTGYDSLKQKLDMVLGDARNKPHLRKAVFEDIVERLQYEAVEMCHPETDSVEADIRWVEKMKSIWAEELPDVGEIRRKLRK